MEKEQFALNISSEKAYYIAKSNIKEGGPYLNLGIVNPYGYCYKDMIVYCFRSPYSRSISFKTTLNFIPVNENLSNITVVRTDIFFYKMLWLIITALSFIGFGLLVFQLNIDYSVVVNGIRRQMHGHPYFILIAPAVISIIMAGVIPTMISQRNKSILFFKSLYGSYIN